MVTYSTLKSTELVLEHGFYCEILNFLLLGSFRSQKRDSKSSYNAIFGAQVNKLWILKVLKIGVSKINPKLSLIEVVHFRWEFVGVHFALRSPSDVIALFSLNNAFNEVVICYFTKRCNMLGKRALRLLEKNPLTPFVFTLKKNYTFKCTL